MGLAPVGQRVALAISDLSHRLNVPLQRNLYDGTSGLGGGAELKGLPKPILLGYCYNFAPVYLGAINFGDGSLETYQINWRDHNDVKVVRESGATLTEVTGVAPTTGQWRQWDVHGCFQLGFTPAGVITCDANGDDPTTDIYANNTGEVVTRMLTALGPLLSTSDLETSTFTDIDAYMAGEIGWFRGTQEISAGDAIDQILRHAGLRLAGGRNGKLRLTFIDPVYAPELLLTEPDIVHLSPEPLPMDLQPAPTHVDVICERNWARLTLSDIAGSVTGATRRKLTSPGARVRASSASIDRRQLSDKTLTLQGLFKNTADAQIRANQLRNWFDYGLRGFRVTTDRYRNVIELGDVVYLTYSKYGLSGGFTGIVTNWEEAPHLGRVTMLLIGS
jgi:hypothetical protein